MDSFQILVYFIVCPLLLYNTIQQQNFLLFLCFLSILCFHLYRDDKDKDWKIPMWTEPIGFIIGFTLFFVSNNIFIKLLGILKMLAHIRQWIFKDYVYY